MDKNKLVQDLVDHMKDYDYYHYQDCYENDEEGFDDITRVLSKDCNGVFEFLNADIDNTLRFEDTRDDYIKEHLKRTVDLAIRVNQYMNYIKENEIEL